MRSAGLISVRRAVGLNAEYSWNFRTILGSVSTERTVAAAFGGPPSVAHAEALLRAVELRRTELDRPLDAIVIGVPGTTPFLPRERPNPLLAAYLGLGLALRMWRDAFPVVDGGTAFLVNRSREIRTSDQQPYRAFSRDACGARPAAARGRRAASQSIRARSRLPLEPPGDRCCRSATGTPASRARAVGVLSSRPGDAAVVRQLASCRTASAPRCRCARAGWREPRIGFLLSPRACVPRRVGLAAAAARALREQIEVETRVAKQTCCSS
jgi:hypothetical protein